MPTNGKPEKGKGRPAAPGCRDSGATSPRDLAAAPRGAAPGPLSVGLPPFPPHGRGDNTRGRGHPGHRRRALPVCPGQDRGQRGKGQTARDGYETGPQRFLEAAGSRQVPPAPGAGRVGAGAPPGRGGSREMLCGAAW